MNNPYRAGGPTIDISWLEHYSNQGEWATPETPMIHGESVLSKKDYWNIDWSPIDDK